MADSRRLLVLSHPAMNPIDREEIERTIGPSKGKSGWDHMDVTSIRAQLHELHEVDWAVAQREQERLFDERLRDEVQRRQRMAYFGFAPIPLAIHLGYLMQAGVKVDVYQRHHDREDWIWLPEEPGPAPSLLKPLQLPEHGSGDAGPVVLRVSTSYRIHAAETAEVVPHSLAQVDLALVEPALDALETKGALAQVIRAFNQALSAVKRLFPNTTAIHLFAAIPVGLAFKMGTQINTTIFPDVVTYQYWNKGSPRYRKAIVLAERSARGTSTGAPSEDGDRCPLAPSELLSRERGPGFLDEPEYNRGNEDAAEFHEILILAYAKTSLARDITSRSGIDQASVHFEQDPRAFWGEILEVAARSGKLHTLWQCVGSDRSIAGHHPRLLALARRGR